MTQKRTISFLNNENAKKLLKEHKTKQLEMAKEHLESVSDKVLDDFESDETVQYETPKQKKDETVKLKNFHSLKAKKKKGYEDT